MKKRTTSGSGIKRELLRQPKENTPEKKREWRGREREGREEPNAPVPRKG
jgi:hypothetical protein